MKTLLSTIAIIVAASTTVANAAPAAPAPTGLYLEAIDATRSIYGTVRQFNTPYSHQTAREIANYQGDDGAAPVLNNADFRLYEVYLAAQVAKNTRPAGSPNWSAPEWQAFAAARSGFYNIYGDHQNLNAWLVRGDRLLTARAVQLGYLNADGTGDLNAILDELEANSWF